MGNIQSNLLNTFGGRTLEEYKEEIKSLYLHNKTPWVIGYSGGKDSTATTQLVYSALSELSHDQLNKTVYILSSDTKVETPAIVNHIDITLDMIQESAKKDGLPFQCVKVEPNTANTFWVNLLGRGYPAPSQQFRWCTDRMKIKPANRFISEQVSRYGEVIMVLGVRSDESASRAQTIEKNKDKYNPDSLLNRHNSLSGAFVYPVIKDFTTDDVWTFLLQNESPWGFDNNSLLALYRSANAGECPLVIDASTNSCGNSRFGCWTCTVVTEDKALTAMVENGEDWLEPLLDFRDTLAKTQKNKEKYRSHKRRNGRVDWKTTKTVKTKDGMQREKESTSVEMSYGPYKFEYLKKFFKELLITEKKVNEENPTQEYFELISLPEIEEIRKLWKSEQQDWEDSVVKIYEEVMAKPYPLSNAKGGGFTGSDYALLDEICAEEGIETNMVAKLLETARSYDGLKRRTKALHSLENVIKEEWRTKEEILKARKEKLERRGVSFEGVQQ
ncbi:DNA phosphorothioation system sulfurtransferase DndC [Halobacteriovorax sp. CON-3]|uniref:DNA phosphorothioation system sulfurtransferase DndC n=1 Tax=Halobacteriovorax sp. CON-3 TaxID=3157710 RepID=UPI0037131179